MGFLFDPKFYSMLHMIDLELAQAVQRRGCPRCSGTLNWANYPRLPRGAPITLPDDFSIRFSLCCSRDGCRRRQTPQSVRFLGRKVYLSVVVILITAMNNGLTSKRISRLEKLLDIDRKTIAEWTDYWKQVFTFGSPFSMAMSGTWKPCSASTDPLGDAYTRFTAFSKDKLAGIITLLKFFSPLGLAPG